MILSLRRRLPLAGLALLALMALPILAACDSGDSKASGSDNAALISAIVTLDNAGFHGIDDAINKEKQVPANARTVALHMQAVTALTEWPSDVKSQADQLKDTLGQLATELDKDSPDLTVAGGLATKVHDVQHDLSHDVWAYLQKQAGINTGSSDSHN